jgi:CheY-like chemotaxis protein
VEVSTMRVLVVDDDAISRRVLATVLAKQGLGVVVAEDGETALAEWAGAAFRLVLLDLELPGVSGWDVARRLRNQPSRVAVPPIIAVTGTLPSEDPAFWTERGFDGFLLKPVNRASVSELLTRWLPLP